jgi:hypothetical protein
LFKSAELVADATVSISRASSSRTFVLALAAILIATIATLVQPRIDGADDQRAYPHLHTASNIAAEYFFTTIFICLMTVLCVSIFTRRGFFLRFNFFRDFLEASNVRRELFSAVYFMLGSISLGLTAHFYWPAIQNILDLFRGLISLFSW